jgi:putative phosphoribosyl transferase
MRIAVLTTGGDAPGLNAAIRAAVRIGIDRRWEILGVRHGYAGLVRGDFVSLGLRDVGGIIQRGGTILGSKRFPEFKTDEIQLEAVRVLREHGIDGAIVIGGDGSQTGAFAQSLKCDTKGPSGVVVNGRRPEKGKFDMIAARKAQRDSASHEVSIDVEGVTLEGTLVLPKGATGVVLFAHGSGSSRHSPRNRYVAEVLHSRGIATLLFDLMTREEESIDQYTAELRFDIPFLAKRLVGATKWIRSCPDTADLEVGYFGASTGAGAALMAAAELPDVVSAVVSRGGRPDLAKDALGAVRAPTLLIVGGDDQPVIGMNREALAKLKCPDKKLVTISGATHLFEEPGTLQEVARMAAEWFSRHFKPAKKSQAQSVGGVRGFGVG